MEFKKIAAVVVTFIVLVISPLQTLAYEPQLGKKDLLNDETVENQGSPIAEEELSIELNIPTLTLKLKRGKEVLKEYTVAVGRNIYQTPIGEYKVINKVKFPTWYPEGRPPVPPGPSNPLGTRWLGIHNGYGIHGNNRPSSIGNFISKGCIRLYNKDAEELFNLVEIGCPVNITYKTVFVKQDEYTGERYLEVYPDVYNIVDDMKTKILKLLEENSINLPEPRKKLLLKRLNTEKLVFSKTPVLQINGNTVTNDVILHNNDYYVNAYAVEDFLGLKIDLNKGSNSLYLYQEPFSFYKQGEKIYIPVEELASFLKTGFAVDAQGGKININAFYSIFNDEFLSTGVILRGGVPFIALRDLADKLGKQVLWDAETHKIMVEGKEVDTVVYSSTSYVTLQEAEGLFEVYSHWNKNKGVVKLINYRAYIDNKLKIPGFKVIDEGITPLIPIRFVGEYLGYNVGWDGEHVLLNERPIDSVIIHGKAYAKHTHLEKNIDVEIEWFPNKGLLNIITQQKAHRQ